MQTKGIAHQVYIGLGTNIGAKRSNLNTALEQIEKRIGTVVACSAFYDTAPVGFSSDNNFLNAVCCVYSSLTPLEILALTQAIEQEMGRTQKSEDGIYADRVIDLDLLLYDNLSIVYDNLVLPHPHLHEREFVLTPLVEIADDLMHPTLNKTMAELLNELG